MIEGSCGYIDTVREHLNLLNGTRQGRQLLMRLGGFRLPIVDEIPGVCSFIEKNWMYSEGSYLGRTRVIYDPSYSAPSAPSVPSWVYLFHELVHANQSLRRGTYDSDRECRATGLGPFRTEMFSENALRCELGLPVRTSYVGEECGPAGTCRNGAYR